MLPNIKEELSCLSEYKCEAGALSIKPKYCYIYVWISNATVEEVNWSRAHFDKVCGSSWNHSGPCCFYFLEVNQENYLGHFSKASTSQILSPSKYKATLPWRNIHESVYMEYPTNSLNEYDSSNNIINIIESVCMDEDEVKYLNDFLNVWISFSTK